MRVSAVFFLFMVLITVPTTAQDIIAAAAGGDLDRVRELLSADPGAVSATDDRQCTALHFAVHAGQAELATLLLDKGADLEGRDVDGDTPLHWAACTDHAAMIDLLLDRGAQIDALNHDRVTPVLYATQRLKYANVEKLAARGADLEIPNDYGRTPLIWTARERGDLEMARLLLRLGVDVDAADRFGATALELAAWRGFGTLVGMLLDAGARTDVHPGMDRELLFMAASMGLDRLYETVIASGASVDVTPRGYVFPLHVAASGGSALIVRDLLDRGAEPDVVDPYGWTPLHHAADRGRTEVARVLAAADPVADRATLSGYTPLNLAHAKGDPDLIRILEAAGHVRTDRAFPVLTAPYLDQGDPPPTPEPFALDIVASCWGQHGGVSFTPDGREAFWSGYTDLPDSSYHYVTILTSRLEDGAWTPPAPASFVDGENRGDVPFVTPDGRRVFFLSTRALNPGETGFVERVWYVEREDGRWGDPRPLPDCVNDMPHHWQISVAANGNLYFASDRSEPGTRGVYVSRPIDGIYTEPEFLGFTGGSPYIAPDESYLITVEAHGRDNVLRIRDGDGTWGDPVSITEFMPGATGTCPRITPDERAYVFLNGRLDAAADFWVAADFLDEWKRLASLPGAAAALERAARAGGMGALSEVVADMDSDPDRYHVSERDLNGAGYRLMGDGLVDEAIVVFTLNLKYHPESANVHDSLGEAYMKAGRHDGAVARYRNALALDPDSANAAERLERLASSPGEPLPLKVERISERVLTVASRTQNSSVVVVAAERGLVVIDVMWSERMGRRVREIATREFGRDDFSHLILIGASETGNPGAAAFAEAEIVAHEDYLAALVADQEGRAERFVGLAGQFRDRVIRSELRLLADDIDAERAEGLSNWIAYCEAVEADLRGDSEDVMPTRTFDGDLVLDMGDVTLELIHFGRIQRGGDLIVRIQEEDLLHLGDVFHAVHALPYFPTDPDVPQYMAALDRACPGGEPPSVILRSNDGHWAWTSASVKAARRLLGDLWTETNAAKERGDSLEDCLAACLPPGERFPYTDVFAMPDVLSSDIRHLVIKIWRRGQASAALDIAGVLAESGTDGAANRLAAIEAAPDGYYFSEGELNGAGYRLLGDGRVAEAVWIFELAVGRYPDSANVHDSLGEAYMAAGRDDEAAASYRRSLALDPENVNATAMLERLSGRGAATGE